MIPDQPLLRGRGDQLAVPFKYMAVVKAAGFAGAGAFNGIKQPVIHAKIPVKPHGMIQACNLNVRVPESAPVGIERCRDQAEVRGIGQYVFVNAVEFLLIIRRR